MPAVQERRTPARIRVLAAAVTLTLVLGACERGPIEPEPDAVPGEYIVMFKPHVQDVEGLARHLAERNHGTILSVWVGLKGFGLRLPQPSRFFVVRIRAHPDVRSIEPNYIGSYNAE